MAKARINRVAKVAAGRPAASVVYANKRQKTGYDLSQSQVSTPPDIVNLFWQITRTHRSVIGSVIDMGAGDGRFAMGGTYSSYEGVEIDRGRLPLCALPPCATMAYGCVFRYPPSGFAACIGNPPYVRHHDIETAWRDRILTTIYESLGFHLDQRSNLFLYFMCLALMKSAADGLIAMIVPFEWVSRPSAKLLRQYLKDQGWAVSVYRFQQPVFADVLTTSSVTVIDKSRQCSAWEFFDVSEGLNIKQRQGLSGTGEDILPYENRGDIWALRGLSPGSQRIFTLTEWERLHHGLHLSDVRPCVTTLRHLPPAVSNLTPETFRKHFVETGQRCWLIRSDRTLTKRLVGYLAGVPEEIRNNYTCKNREHWFRYLTPPIPKLLVSSGFVTYGPKILINSLGGTAVGSVYGVHTERSLSVSRLRDHLLSIKLEDKVVPHAASLKKVEVKQLNGVLTAFLAKMGSHGR
jgi:hypothetical protein